MRLYAAYIDPASLEPDRRLILVKDGMCWPAFFFSVLWALWHRLWGVAAALLAATIVLEAVLAALGADEITAFVLSLALAFFIGTAANDWRGRALERRGAELAGIVAARTPMDAARRFFEGGGHDRGYRSAGLADGVRW